MTEKPTQPEISASPNPADLKRQALKAILPEAFTEGRIDVAALKRALGEETLIESGERYRLDWVGKSEAYKVLQTPTTATLRPRRDQSVNFDTASHVFIEGENLETLKVLQKAYFGKVKLIYIDPPYNTGNDHFVYPDRFQESKEDYLKRINELDDDGSLMREGFFRKNSRESGHYHSNWLSMMLPRLYIARNLLHEQGVIFVAIDDNELHNLRALMNEVFGEENFRGIISRATGTPTGQGTNSLINEKDYMVVYSRSEAAEFSGLPFSEKDIEKYNLKDRGGKYLLRPLRKTGGEDRRQDRPSMYFGIASPDGSIVYPIGPGGYESRWRCGRKRYQDLVAENRIEWKQKTDADEVTVWVPYQKFYLEGKSKQPSNLWVDLAGNKQASRHVAKLISSRIFDHPKPVDVIRRCIQIASATDSIILDFFAGSGTTFEAVVRQNVDDGGQRQCILVQHPEPLGKDNSEFSDIAQVARTRIRAVLDELRQSEDLINKLPEGEGFKAYTLAPSNFRQWRGEDIEDGEDLAEQIKLFKQSEKDGAESEAILHELLLKLGYPLTTPVESMDIGGHPVQAIDHGKVVFVLQGFDQAMIDPLIELNPEHVVTLDSVFENSDPLKSNLSLQCRDAGIRFSCF